MFKFKEGDRVKLRRWNEKDPKDAVNYSYLENDTIFPDSKQDYIIGVVKKYGVEHEDFTIIVVNYSDSGGPKNWYSWDGGLTLIPNTTLKDWE